jgi:hypothetical protein
MFPAAPQTLEEDDPPSEPWFIDTFFHMLASVLHSARNNPCHLAALQKQAADHGALGLMVVSAATLAEKFKEASDADDVASTYTWQVSYMTTSFVRALLELCRSNDSHCRALLLVKDGKGLDDVLALLRHWLHLDFNIVGYGLRMMGHVVQVGMFKPPSRLH